MGYRDVFCLLTKPDICRDLLRFCNVVAAVPIYPLFRGDQVYCPDQYGFSLVRLPRSSSALFLYVYIYNQMTMTTQTSFGRPPGDSSDNSQKRYQCVSGVLLVNIVSVTHKERS